MSATPPPVAPATHQFHQKLTFSVSEAVVATGLGRTTLYSLMKSGKLRFRTICSRRLIDGNSLRALVLGEAAE